MSSSHPIDKGKAKKNERVYECYFCERIFQSHHALGGHQKVHQGEIKELINQMYTYPSSNSMNVTRSNPPHENAPMKTLSKGNNYDAPMMLNQSSGTMPSAQTMIAPAAYMSPSNIHISPVSTNQNPMIPSNNPIDVSKSNIGHAKDMVIPLPDDPKNNSYTFTGNYYDNYTKDKNKSVMLSQADETIPSALLMEPPIYMGSSGNPINPASNAGSNVYHQYNVGGSKSIAGYDVNGFSLSTSPNFFHGVDINEVPSLNEPNVADLFSQAQTQFVDPPGNYSDYNNNNNMARICSRANKRAIGEVQGHSMVMSSPKRQNMMSTEMHLPTKDEKVGNNKDAKVEDNHVVLFDGAVERGSVPQNANCGKENDEADLDLTLHL